jgi:ferrochelatase
MALRPKCDLAAAKQQVANSAAPEGGKTGVLFVNLGTPSAPTSSAIRAYLREFLSDPRVVELSRLVWLPILYGLILMRRPSKLVPRYRRIWMAHGSPLQVYSQRQVEAVAGLLAHRGMPVTVRLAMRYGAPSVASSIARLSALGCERMLIVPMYPQYAASTTATVTDAVSAYVARLRNQPELRFIKRFHDDHGYLTAIAQGIERFWRQHGRPQKLLMSFHGLPERMVQRGDPYYQDCMCTGRLLGEQLGLDAAQVQITFQSRFGLGQWLQPATVATLQALARGGVQDVDIVCPGFLADCLETLDEIQTECRDIFLMAGGRQLRYIPAVNDDSLWVTAFAGIVQRHLQGWPTPA